MKKIYKFKIQNSKFLKIEKIWRIKKPKEKLEVEYRVVVEDGGRVDLGGKMVVEKTAVNSDVFLRYRVLLMGSEARALVLPELEILTNELKAGHAASVGRIDEEQIFYMMSRGLSRAEAVELLVKAFLN